jgi:5-methylcytosine-specific restriction endonuclease McrA
MPMSRKEFGIKVRQQALERAQYRCEGILPRNNVWQKQERCSITFGGLSKAKPEFDHILACLSGGDNSLPNCQVLCKDCHNSKTGKQDVAPVRKAVRKGLKAIGAFPKSKTQWASRPFNQQYTPRSKDIWADLEGK